VQGSPGGHPFNTSLEDRINALKLAQMGHSNNEPSGGKRLVMPMERATPQGAHYSGHQHEFYPVWPETESWAQWSAAGEIVFNEHQDENQHAGPSRLKSQFVKDPQASRYQQQSILGDDRVNYIEGNSDSRGNEMRGLSEAPPTTFSQLDASQVLNSSYKSTGHQIDRHTTSMVAPLNTLKGEAEKNVRKMTNNSVQNEGSNPTNSRFLLTTAVQRLSQNTGLSKHTAQSILQTTLQSPRVFGRVSNAKSTSEIHDALQELVNHAALQNNARFQTGEHTKQSAIDTSIDRGSRDHYSSEDAYPTSHSELKKLRSFRSTDDERDERNSIVSGFYPEESSDFDSGQKPPSAVLYPYGRTREERIYPGLNTSHLSTRGRGGRLGIDDRVDVLQPHWCDPTKSEPEFYEESLINTDVAVGGIPTGRCLRSNFSPANDFRSEGQNFGRVAYLSESISRQRPHSARSRYEECVKNSSFREANDHREQIRSPTPILRGPTARHIIRAASDSTIYRIDSGVSVSSNAREAAEIDRLLKLLSPILNDADEHEPDFRRFFGCKNSKPDDHSRGSNRPSAYADSSEFEKKFGFAYWDRNSHTSPHDGRYKSQFGSGYSPARRRTMSTQSELPETSRRHSFSGYSDSNIADNSSNCWGVRCQTETPQPTRHPLSSFSDVESDDLGINLLRQQPIPTRGRICSTASEIQPPRVTFARTDLSLESDCEESTDSRAIFPSPQASTSFNDFIPHHQTASDALGTNYFHQPPTPMRSRVNSVEVERHRPRVTFARTDTSWKSVDDKPTGSTAMYPSLQTPPGGLLRPFTTKFEAESVDLGVSIFCQPPTPTGSSINPAQSEMQRPRVTYASTKLELKPDCEESTGTTTKYSSTRASPGSGFNNFIANHQIEGDNSNVKNCHPAPTPTLTRVNSFESETQRSRATYVRTEVGLAADCEELTGLTAMFPSLRTTSPPERFFNSVTAEHNTDEDSLIELLKKGSSRKTDEPLDNRSTGSELTADVLARLTADNDALLERYTQSSVLDNIVAKHQSEQVLLFSRNTNKGTTCEPSDNRSAGSEPTTDVLARLTADNDALLKRFSKSEFMTRSSESLRLSSAVRPGIVDPPNGNEQAANRSKARMDPEGQSDHPSLTTAYMNRHKIAREGADDERSGTDVFLDVEDATNRGTANAFACLSSSHRTAEPQRSPIHLPLLGLEPNPKSNAESNSVVSNCMADDTSDTAMLGGLRSDAPNHQLPVPVASAPAWTDGFHLAASVHEKLKEAWDVSILGSAMKKKEQSEPIQELPDVQTVEKTPNANIQSYWSAVRGVKTMGSFDSSSQAGPRIGLTTSSPIYESSDRKAQFNPRSYGVDPTIHYQQPFDKSRITHPSAREQSHDTHQPNDHSGEQTTRQGNNVMYSPITGRPEGKKYTSNKERKYAVAPPTQVEFSSTDLQGGLYSIGPLFSTDSADDIDTYTDADTEKKIPRATATGCSFFCGDSEWKLAIPGFSCGPR
jgi:hypothetical protein